MIILWLLFGSLGSVILTRFADGITRIKLRDFFFGRSKCPHCSHTLGITDLVPLLSYLVHWGRCRYCGKSISWIYPVLEILSAGIFLWTYLRMGEFWRGIIIFRILTNRLLILLLLYDIQKYELHMSVRYLVAIMGVVGNIILPNGNLWNALYSTILFTWAFLIIYFFAKRYVKIRFKEKKEGFGEGDIYLAFIAWMYLPLIFSFQNMLFSWSMIIKSLVIYILMSSIIGLIRAWLQYLLSKKLHFEQWMLNIIPFFPAMIIAFRIFAWKAQVFIALLS